LSRSPRTKSARSATTGSRVRRRSGERSGSPSLGYARFARSGSPSIGTSFARRVR
jgi:hypothetical protein